VFSFDGSSFFSSGFPTVSSKFFNWGLNFWLLFFYWHCEPILWSYMLNQNFAHFLHLRRQLFLNFLHKTCNLLISIASTFCILWIFAWTLSLFPRTATTRFSRATFSFFDFNKIMWMFSWCFAFFAKIKVRAHCAFVSDTN